MTESLTGKTIGKYQIVEHLGRGGMAEVYKAYQPGLDRYVAIKLMHSFLADEKDFLGRFQREAKAVARLRHANIVQVHDFDVAEGVYYMVMEFIDGYTLKEKLYDFASENKILPLSEAIRITRDVASALAYAHEREMVHRDIKPANVMIDKDDQVGCQLARWREQHLGKGRAVFVGQAADGDGHLCPLGQFEVLVVRAGVEAEHVVIAHRHGDHGLALHLKPIVPIPLSGRHWLYTNARPPSMK